MALKQTFLLLILSLTFKFSLSQWPTKVHALSICYGTVLSLEQNLRHHVSIENWISKSTCTKYNLKGEEIRIEFSDINDLNIGINVFLANRKHHKSDIQSYFGLNPSVFSINKKNGINLAPEFGFRLTSISEKIGVGGRIYYGYDIPIINKSEFKQNRHRITIKISLDKIFSSYGLNWR